MHDFFFEKKKVFWHHTKCLLNSTMSDNPSQFPNNSNEFIMANFNIPNELLYSLNNNNASLPSSSSSVPFVNTSNMFSQQFSLPQQHQLMYPMQHLQPQQQQQQQQSFEPSEKSKKRKKVEEDTSAQESTKREQPDRYLPIANIARIMKRNLPANAKISKESKDAIQEAVSEFISFITMESLNRCNLERRKTVNGDDILWALQNMGFDNYLDPLHIYLEKYRAAMSQITNQQGSSNSSANNAPQEEESEDEEDDAEEEA